jgi:hypothetical protein
VATYFGEGTAPDPGIEDRAQIAAGVAQAMAAVNIAQQEAHSFFTSYGPAVSAGHPDTNAAGRMGDPDLSAPDAADSSGG